MLAAGGTHREESAAALSQLCQIYWHPLYSFVRRRGFSDADAQDLTQAFFAHLIEKRTLGIANPQRGRFRSFLLSCIDHFLSNERDRALAKKRGGGRQPLSLDAAHAGGHIDREPTDEFTAERHFHRQWALTMLKRVLDRLADEYTRQGKTRQFELLSDCLSTDRKRLPYAQLAAELGISTEAARQAAHRMRQRYRFLLREEVARTLADPTEVDDELADLFQALER